MPAAELWTLDQAHAWTVWRDQDSVDRVKPGQLGSACTFRTLLGIRKRGYRTSRRPVVAKLHELDHACAAGALKAVRLFVNGTTERIPAHEWRDGTPNNPQQIRFLPSDVMVIFPRSDEVPPSHHAVQRERPQEGVTATGELVSAPSSTPSAPAFRATAIRSGAIAEGSQLAEWITLLEAIEHVQRVGDAAPREAVEKLRVPLREGKIRSRHWGTDRPIEPLAWYRAKIFSDGGVEFCSDNALLESRLKTIGLGSIRDRVEVNNSEMMRYFPEPAEKRRRGPKPGTVDRYGEADGGLFGDIEEIMKKENNSVEAAAKMLADANRIVGTGSPDSRATRLAKRYRQDRGRKNLVPTRSETRPN
jgi:hypothetical protein